MKRASPWQSGQVVLEPTYPFFCRPGGRLGERRRPARGPGRADRTRPGRRPVRRGGRPDVRPSGPRWPRRPRGAGHGGPGGVLHALRGPQKWGKPWHLTWGPSWRCAKGGERISVVPAKVAEPLRFPTIFPDAPPLRPHGDFFPRIGRGVFSII